MHRSSRSRLSASGFDGSPEPLARPQNQPGHNGHAQYRGTAPVFATTKADDMQRLMAAGSTNPQTGAPFDTDASMLMRRLKVYVFTVPLAKPLQQIPFCAHCFAMMVLRAGVEA